MRLFNFGSLNIDHVYAVHEFVQPGQTIHAKSYQQFAGGKGLNQSIAAARAGMTVMHMGQIGTGGEQLLEQLDDCGVNTSLIQQVDDPTGHAIIQVVDCGENEIIVFGGANQTLPKQSINAALAMANEGDWVLCQNETNHVDYIIQKASELGLLVAFNPAPMTAAVKTYDLDNVHLLIVNHSEATALTGQSQVEAIVDRLLEDYPQTNMLLTLGAQGAVFANDSQSISVPAEKVTAIDTTAAGDTFIGYFLASFANNDCQDSVESCLKIACQAAALSVQKVGAADSIPKLCMLA